MNKTTPNVSLAQLRTSVVDSTLVEVKSNEDNEDLTDTSKALQTNSQHSVGNHQRIKRKARQDTKKQKITKKVHEMIHEIELLLNLSAEELHPDEIYDFVVKFNGIMGEKLAQQTN